MKVWRISSLSALLRVYPRVVARALADGVLVASGLRQVSARHALTVDAKTGDTLFALGADSPEPPASTLKLLNAVTVRRWIPDDRLADRVRIEASEAGQVGFGLTTGDEVSVEDLLYGMMLFSANDCASALARTVGTIIQASEGETGDPFRRFLREMREVAEGMGAAGVVVADASGNDRDSRLSARCLADIMRALRHDDVLRRVIGAQHREITVHGPRPRSLRITHRFDPEGRPSFPEYLGSKTGSTSNAGSCIVVLWRHPVRGECVTVILGSAVSELRRRDLRWLMDGATASPEPV